METTITTIAEVEEAIARYGFLPLFRNQIPGYSVEEMTNPQYWYTGDEIRDPWYFRETIPQKREITYGKVFRNKAGFITKEWYPYFVNYRRDGYDFDTRYECGLASQMDKIIYDLIEENGAMSSFELKRVICPKSRKGTGFDSSLTRLQMQTYLTVIGFVRKRDKKGEEYGWPAAIYERPEAVFGEEFIKSQYKEEPEQSKKVLINHLQAIFPAQQERQIERLLR